MIRPSALAIASAAALSAALAVAACKPLSPAGAPGSAGAAAPPASATPGGPVQAPPAPSGQDTLLTEPGAGFGQVYSLIDHARSSIDVTMYEFSDPAAERYLAAAAARHVRVSVVLDAREKSANSAAYSYLRGHGVRVAWSSPAYHYTHQKTIVVDGGTAVIMTANLTSKYYPDTRDFLVEDTNRADVAAISHVFSADFAHSAVHPSDAADLVWSPAGSQQQLLAVINGARHSLLVYSEEMGDSTIENALISAARRGVNVRVCGENSDGEYDSAFTRLTRGGVHISYYSSSRGLYIHGKVVEADYGASGARVFIGSENFSSTSLNDNRELGLIISNRAVMASIATTFAADFRNGKPAAAS